MRWVFDFGFKFAQRFLTVGLLLFTSYTHAATGTEWIATQQDPDGSFPTTSTSLATSEQATSEVLSALTVLGDTANPIHAPALAYINSITDSNTEYLSRSIIANAQAGNDVTALVEQLLARQNADGGFGHDEEYSSSVLDTAFALIALGAANIINEPSTVYAVGYLVTQQQDDGGWTDDENATSFYLSALCAKALTPFRFTAIGASNALTKVTDYFLSQRSGSEFWGEIFINALVIQALVPNLADVTVLDSSVVALRNSQAADGSWDQDVYTTALALAALKVVEDRGQGAIDLSRGAIYGRVIESGSHAPISGAIVLINELPGKTISTQDDGIFIFPKLSTGRYTVVATKSGLTSASNVVDVAPGQLGLAGNLILSASAQTGVVMGEVTDAATTQGLEGVAVSLVGSSNITVATDNKGGFDSGAAQPGSYTVTFSKTGYNSVTSPLTVEAGQINRVNASLSAAGAYNDQPGDLSGRVVDGFTGQPLLGALIDLGNGVSVSADALGQFTVSKVSRGTYSINVSSTGYQSIETTFVFSALSGGYVGILKLYPASINDAPNTVTLHGKVVDANTLTPIANATASVAGGPGTASDINGQFTLSGISSKDFQLSLTASGFNGAVYNLQAPAFGAISGEFSMVPGDGSLQTGLTFGATGTVIDGTTNQPLPGVGVAGLFGGVQTTTVTDGAGQFVMTNLTSDNGAIELTLAEYNPRTLYVGLAPLTITQLGQTLLYKITEPLPDLVVSSINSQNAIVDPQTLAITGNVTATITNPGTDLTATPVSLTAFYDNDKNGRYSAIDTLLGQATSAGGLGIGGSEQVVIPAEGILPYRDAPIRVWVDSGSVVEESNENNNVLVSSHACGSPASPDLTISILRAITLPSATSVTLSARIGNGGASAVTAGSATINFYESDPLSSGVLLGTVDVPDLAADSYQDVVLSNVTNLTGTSPIFVVVDPDNQIVECDETNNSMSIPAPDLLPDLVVNSVDVSGVQTDLATLRVTGTVSAEISNQGPIATTQLFQVLAYYDINANGQYDQGIDLALDTQPIASSIGVGVSTVVSFTVDANAPFRDAPVHVWVDNTNSIEELEETNNINSTASACIVTPDIGTFEPVEKWSWTGSTVLPEHDQVMSTPIVATIDDTNGDGKINGLDTPAIIFNSYRGVPRGWQGNGVLRAVSGADGRELWSVTDVSLRTNPAGSIAVADIDLDGLVEIIAPKTGGGIIVFENTGELKWKSNIPKQVLWGGPSVADLDGDGTPEIIVGNTVLNADGSLLWQGSGRYPGGNYLVTGPLSIVADLDNDGKPEVIAGPSAYSNTGQLLWINTTMGDGFTAIGNFDTDSYPEIVVVSWGFVWLLDHTGNVIWRSERLPGGGAGGPPTIADVDGDGLPEIGVAGANAYTMFDTDGTVLWSNPTRDYSNMTGSSVFDFNGDGQAEVVYADERMLRVYRGTDGALIFETPNYSGTTFELPVIADVDNDGHADIVICANQLNGGQFKGIRVFQDINNSWVNTRKIWNQHTYHITNVNDDGSIPTHEKPSWLTHNSYRLNAFLDRNPLASPDLTASLLQVIDNGAGQSASATLRVGNAGAIPSPANVKVSVYQGDPLTGGTLLGHTFIDSVPAGKAIDVRVDGLGIPQESINIFAIVDSDNVVNECNEDNNITSTVVGVSTLATIVVAMDKAIYGPNEVAILQGLSTNTGSVSGEFLTELRLEDANGFVMQTYLAKSTGVLVSQTSSTNVETWSTDLILAGTYRLRGFVRALDGTVIDEALTSFEVRNSAINTPLVSLRSWTDKTEYHTTDTVIATAQTQNLSVNTIIENTFLEVKLTDSNGQVIETQTIDMTGGAIPGSVRDWPVSFNLLNAAEGQHTVTTSWKDIDGNVLAANNTSFNIVHNLALAITGSVTAAYNHRIAGEPQTCSALITNNGALAINNLPVRQLFVDLTTNAILGEQAQTLNLEGGAQTTFDYAVNTASAVTEGDHACLLQLQIDGQWQPLDFAAFFIEIPIRLEGELNQGDRGRVLILLDTNRARNKHGQACSGVTKVDLRSVLATPMSPTAQVDVSLIDANGLEVDRESTLVGDMIVPVDLWPGQGANLSLIQATNDSLTVAINAEINGVLASPDYRVQATITDGNTLLVQSEPVPVDCTPPLRLGDVFGAFSVTDLVTQDAANDPYGSTLAPDLIAQKLALETLLTNNGWSYTIVETATGFGREFHTGGYATYLLLGESTKLPTQLQNELRVAVFRGEGLIVAGPHDDRNMQHPRLNEALGLKIAGSLPGAISVTVPQGPLSDTGGDINLFADEKILRVKPDTAETLASYTLSTDAIGQGAEQCDHRMATRKECETLNAAILRNSYGRGRSIFAGFDLLAASTRDGETSLAATVILRSLEQVHPSTLPTSTGSVVPLAITVTNVGLDADARVSLSLPAGVTVIDAGDLTETNNTLIWQGFLPAGASVTLNTWLRLPDSAGDISLNATVEGARPGTNNYLPQPDLNLVITVQPGQDAASIEQALDAAIANGVGPKNELNKAGNALARAIKAEANNPDTAIKEGLKAADALARAGDHPDITLIRVMLGDWLKELGQRLN